MTPEKGHVRPASDRKSKACNLSVGKIGFWSTNALKDGELFLLEDREEKEKARN